MISWARFGDPHETIVERNLEKVIFIPLEDASRGRRFSALINKWMKLCLFNNRKCFALIRASESLWNDEPRTILENNTIIIFLLLLWKNKKYIYFILFRHYSRKFIYYALNNTFYCNMGKQFSFFCLTSLFRL